MRERGTISFSREAESLTAKARWFRSLTLEERMDLFVEFTDLALAGNPNVFKVKAKHAQASRSGVLVLTRP